MDYKDYIKDLRKEWGNVFPTVDDDDMTWIEKDEELFEHLNERIRDLEDENYTLKEELKGFVEDDDVRFVCVHNRLTCFEDNTDYIPITHIGDSVTRKTIIELQTGDEELNKKISELICILLNCNYF